MLKTLKFLLYGVAFAAGAIGAAVTGWTLLRHLFGHLSGTYSLSDEALFRVLVLFFLSLATLILVHIGHRVTGAFLLPEIELASAKAKPEGRAWWRR